MTKNRKERLKAVKQAKRQEKKQRRLLDIPEKYKTKPADNRRGTPYWAMNVLRSDLLTNLLLDLHTSEEVGLSDEECRVVTTSLEKMAIIASEIPDKWFIFSSIKSALDRFTEAYKDWNDPKGADTKAREGRRKALVLLSDRRHSLAKVVHRNRYIISNEVDMQLIKSLYATAGAIPKQIPKLFKNVAGSVKRFSRAV